MKFTLGWLKDHLDTTAPIDQISKTLTAIGLEVESVTDMGAALKGFTVAKVLEATQHPNADKLRVCKVQSDAGELQIVCGAPNARAGIFVALAKEGAIIPNGGMVIKKTKIRSVESNGMLCSREELNLPGDSEGIIELPASPIGTPITDVLGLNDPVIDVAVTPNRADALSVRGIARDLASAGLGTLKSAPSYIANENCESFWNSPQFDAFLSPISAQVNVANNNCSTFYGYYIRNVNNEQSPDWINKRLDAIGQKSISALVDITNYLMFDLGRPMHAYDADKITGNIQVRDALDGEKFKALNGQEYTLDHSMTVIADAHAVIGLAGIIGGESTACSQETKNVFLEVANFNSINIAKTARRLGILSEARYRFERGVDSNTLIKIDTTPQPIDRDVPSVAVYLINKCCGGSASHLIDALVEGGWKTPFIKLRFDRIAALSGVAIDHAKAKAILTTLGFICMDVTGGLDVVPPSWRRDVEGEADLIEEVLRIHGYDNIPSTPLPKLPIIGKPALNTNQKRAHLAKRALAGRGMLEAVTWSFLPANQAALFGGKNPALKLLNPISADLDTMRPSLLPNLLSAAQKNANRGFANVGLFEVGLQFTGIAPNEQQLVAAAITTGEHTAVSHENGLLKQVSRPVNAFDAKAEAMNVLAALGVEKCDITTNVPGHYHPGRSGALTLGGKIILGYFGEIHPAVIQAFGLEGACVGFELFLEALPVARSKKPKALALSDFQAVERDFAFTVDAHVTAAEITKALSGADKNLITGIELFDVYAGKGIEPGKKSVAVKVVLQAVDRTLSEQDIAAVSQAVVAAAKGFGGSLRS